MRNLVAEGAGALAAEPPRRACAIRSRNQKVRQRGANGAASPATGGGAAAMTSRLGISTAAIYW
eukprot:6212638-Pleurochrysis_carterae.AAC.6